MQHQEEIQWTSELQLSLSPSSITISRGTMHQIGDPDYIQLMIDEDKTRIAILASPADLGDVLPVPNGPDDVRNPVVYQECDDLLEPIWDTFHWDRNKNYIITGKVTRIPDILIFDLLSAICW